MTEHKSLSLLVVDDDPDVLESLRVLLEREPGYEVQTAGSGTEALDLLENRSFDVILSDFSMPEPDGLSLLRELRARGCRSLFVIVTGKRLAHIAMDALNSGADYYLQKGADMARDLPRLIAFINTTVPQRRAEREIAAWERFYRSVVEETPDLICHLGPDGSVAYANRSCLRFLSVTYDEVLREIFFSRVPGDEREGLLARLRSLSSEDPDVLVEHSIRAAAKTHVLQWQYHGLFSEGGILSGYLISGRKAENPVRIPTAGIPPAPDSAGAAAGQPGRPDDFDWNGLAETIRSVESPVFAINRAGTVIAWNWAMAELTGITAAGMVGKGNREYAIPFYGTARPMLVDRIFADSQDPSGLPEPEKEGDTYIGGVERVTLRGKPMLIREKGSPVYDAAGTAIAAIEMITAGEPEEDEEAPGGERYLGGVSSITLKVSGKGVGGAIAGAIGSSTGGYGVYATDRRVFVIRNPDLDAGTSEHIRFSTFIMDELFGTTVDTGRKSIRDLEKLKVFEADKGYITDIILKKPVLLSGYLTFRVGIGGSFRVYIDHKKSFTQIEALMESFCPEKIRRG